MDLETYLKIIEPLMIRFKRYQTLEMIEQDFKALAIYRPEDLKAAVDAIILNRTQDSYPTTAEILDAMIDQISRSQEQGDQTDGDAGDCQACGNRGYVYDNPETNTARACCCQHGERYKAAARAITRGADRKQLIGAVNTAPAGKPAAEFNFFRDKQGRWQPTISTEEKRKQYLLKALDDLEKRNKMEAEKTDGR